MFTGLVEDIGTIESIRAADGITTLVVRSAIASTDTALGASIAISGVCLTVTELAPPLASFEVMGETLDRSTLGLRGVGDQVNIERSLRAGDRLGGHIVQGHVDAVAELVSVAPHERWRVLRFALTDAVAPLVTEKGSVAIDGVSLTVSAVSAPGSSTPWLEVSLIPETLERTTLGALSPGDRVNIETDILARHVARLAAFGGTTDGTSE